MGSSLFHHGHRAEVDDEQVTTAPERGMSRSLLASPWFWIGGLLSMAVWAGLYAVFVR